MTSETRTMKKLCRQWLVEFMPKQELTEQEAKLEQKCRYWWKRGGKPPKKASVWK